MRREAIDDFSGLEKYLDDDKGRVKIPEADCLLVDDCSLNYDHTLGVIKVGSRMLLLSRCGMGEGYVYCNVKLIMELPYTSLEEILADTHWHEGLKKDIREIDSLAYGLYCDLYR